jgi:hypothetical protein
MRRANRERLSEHAVDKALGARISRAAKYVGWPRLFVMRLAPSLP